jgi:chemotaxis protein MotA
MGEITSSLNLAFDTTLVALVVGLILNFFYHQYLQEVDTFYSRTRGYVIDNLISRIYKPEHVQVAKAKVQPSAFDLTSL